MMMPMKLKLLAFISTVFLKPKTQSFSIQQKPQNFANKHEQQPVFDPNHDSTATDISRRQSISSISKGTIASLILSSTIIKSASAAEPKNNNNNSIGTIDHPIAIIGGGGRTGMVVAESIASESFGQMNGVIMTRSAKDPFQIIKIPETTKNRLSFYDQSVDVRDYNSVLTALKKTQPSVVVFAASASKQGGNSFDVDGSGVANVAQACKNVGCQLVLISALAVDRPESKSFQITNSIGGYMDKIMDAKLSGEDAVKKALGKKGYVIIRSGVLLNGKSKSGASGIELNQGDTIGGGLSRDELAGVVVGAIQNGKRGVTVEAYRKSTATKLQPDFTVPSGNELTASTYKDLFANAKEDS